MSSPVVLFYVQHLWGVGHVYRATRIATALANAGMEVHLVWGGTMVPDFDFSGLTVHHLPAVRSRSAEFSELVHADGREFSNADQDARRNQLLELLAILKPDILITEAFPFGRRQMLFELLPLLQAAGNMPKPPMIVSSIRDIMQEGRKQKRVDESLALVKEHFHLILVHGDPDLVSIEETLQGAESIREKIRYTGLVTPQPDFHAPSKDFTCDVVVTVGGGAFGQELTSAAIEAMPLCKRYPRNWLVSAGSQLPDAEYEDLKKRAPPGMRLVRHISDLASVMRHASVSVSHAGYNTVADLLRAKCAAVLYPYTGGRETEQLRRAQLMHEKGLAEVIEPGSLSAEMLASLIEKAASQKPASFVPDLEGSRNSAKILANEYGLFRR